MLDENGASGDEHESFRSIGVECNSIVADVLVRDGSYRTCVRIESIYLVGKFRCKAETIKKSISVMKTFVK